MAGEPALCEANASFFHVSPLSPEITDVYAACGAFYITPFA
jgi:hypothetical protein